MGDAEELPTKIAKWLKDSGRDLELQVARAARSAGALTAQSVPYVDRDTGKAREADVLAEFAGHTAAVTILTECKKAAGKQWVAFPHDEGRISSQPIQHHAVIDPKDFIRVHLLEQAWQASDSIFGPEPAIAAALVDADIGKNASERDKDANTLDTASRALRQCLSAARGLTSEFDEAVRAPRIVVPVVVSNAQLWTCRLTNDDQLQVESTDYRLRQGSSTRHGWRLDPRHGPAPFRAIRQAGGGATETESARHRRLGPPTGSYVHDTCRRAPS